MEVGKKVFVGLESSGKSLLMSKELRLNIKRNIKWEKITGKKRPIYYNLSLSDEIKEYANENGIELRPWSNIWSLTEMSECDLYIDELATYFDSRFFSDLPLDVRLWLAQAEKMGVQIVGATQDYFMIDISFRRLVKKLYEIKKVVGSPRPMQTAPPVNFIWGLMLIWELDARSATRAGNQEEMQVVGGILGKIPKPFILRKKHTKNFNTQTRVSLSDPPPLRKYVRVCPEDGHKIIKYL